MAYANAVRATTVSAITGLRRIRRRRGDASASNGIDSISVIALRRARNGQYASTSVLVQRVARSAIALIGRDAIAADATSRALRQAVAGVSVLIAWPATAYVRRDALAALATSRTMRNAGLTVVGGIDVPATESG